VRDSAVWNEFVPAPASTSAPRYRVVSFHFNEGTDAAGFVAWLAAHLKRSAGTGSVVICGKDRRDTPELFRTSQGVFDYWCCAVTAGDRFCGAHTIADHARSTSDPVATGSLLDSRQQLRHPMRYQVRIVAGATSSREGL